MQTKWIEIYVEFDDWLMILLMISRCMTVPPLAPRPPLS